MNNFHQKIFILPLARILFTSQLYEIKLANFLFGTFSISNGRINPAEFFCLVPKHNDRDQNELEAN